MNILVTGSEGNFGHFLVKDLAKEGHRVIRADYAPKVKIEGDLALGDLSHKPFLEEIFRAFEFEAVIHCAARLYGVAGFNADVFGLFQNDVSMLLNLLKAVERRPVRRLVYLSSSMVYETSKAPEFFEDSFDSLMPPNSSYGLTKFIGERTLRYFKMQHPEFDFTVWRPFNIVSPREHFRPYAHVFVDLAQKILVQKEKTVTFVGDGSQKRCFTWVEDVSQTVARCSFADFSKGEALNVGQTEILTIRDLAKIIADYGVAKNVIRKQPEFRTGSEPVYDVKHRRPSVVKLNRFYSTKDFVPPRKVIEMYLEQALVVNNKGEISWRN